MTRASTLHDALRGSQAEKRRGARETHAQLARDAPARASSDILNKGHPPPPTMFDNDRHNTPSWRLTSASHWPASPSWARLTSLRCPPHLDRCLPTDVLQALGCDPSLFIPHFYSRECLRCSVDVCDGRDGMYAVAHLFAICMRAVASDLPSIYACTPLCLV